MIVVSVVSFFLQKIEKYFNHIKIYYINYIIKMKWEDHSVAELRTVARAYKKHMMIGAPSKMSKKELIAVLNKHLMIEDGTNKIKIRAVAEQPLMGKNLEKSKKERLAKAAAKQTPKKAAEAEARAAYAMVKPDILKTSTQMMSAFFDAEQIKLDAEIMMAQMKTDALKAEREKIILQAV